MGRASKPPRANGQTKTFLPRGKHISPSSPSRMYSKGPSSSKHWTSVSCSVQCWLHTQLVVIGVSKHRHSSESEGNATLLSSVSTNSIFGAHSGSVSWEDRVLEVYFSSSDDSQPTPPTKPTNTTRNAIFVEKKKTRGDNMDVVCKTNSARTEVQFDFCLLRNNKTQITFAGKQKLDLK